MSIVFRLIVSTVIILIASYILPGVHIASIWTALVVALVLGILNVIIKPILIILTLPITLLSLGLFMLVINGFVIILTSYIVPGFKVDNFGWAVLFSIVISIFNWFVNRQK